MRRTTGRSPSAGMEGTTSRAPPGHGARGEQSTTGAHEALYGEPGKPLASSPFLIGLTGGLGLLTAWALSQALVTSRSVIVLIVVAMFLAVGLNPAVEALQRRRMARRWAISIVFGAVILFFVLFGLAIVPPVTQEAAAFVERGPRLHQGTARQPDAQGAGQPTTRS